MSNKKPVPPSLAQFALEQLAEAGEQAAIDLTVQNVEISRAEIERRDARIVELEAPMLAWAELDYTKHTRRSLMCYIGQQNFRITAQENQLAALKAQQPSGVAPDQDGSAAQKSFWAGFEASVCGFNGLNIRAAWNEFKSSEQFKRLNPCRAQSDGWVCGNCGFNVQTRLDDGAQQKESGDE